MIAVLSRKESEKLQNPERKCYLEEAIFTIGLDYVFGFLGGDGVFLEEFRGLQRILEEVRGNTV